MDRIRSAWARFAKSPRRLALTAAVALVAVVGGVAFAFAVNGIRQPSGAGGSPSAAAAIDVSASELASISPTPTPKPTSTKSACEASAAIGAIHPPWLPP